MSDNEAAVVEPKKGRGRPPKGSKSKKEEKPVDKAGGDSKEEVPLKRGRPMRKAAEEANKKSVEKKDDEDDEPKAKRSRGRPAGTTKKGGKRGRPAKGKRGRPGKASVNNSAKENETNEASPEDEEEEEEEAASSGEEKTD